MNVEISSENNNIVLMIYKMQMSNVFAISIVNQSNVTRVHNA